MQPHTSQSILTLFDKKNNEEVPLEGLYNIEAEQALLGALILNNSTYEDISDFLKAEHFSQKIHSTIFQSISNTLERGRIADPITLKDVLTNDPDFIELGGFQYLIDLSDSVYSLVSVVAYGHLIYEMYKRRQLVSIGHETIVDARNFKEDRSAENVIEDAERSLYNLAMTGNYTQKGVSLNEGIRLGILEIEDAVKNKGEIVGVTTGFVDLDNELSGLHPSDLIIIAGRPAMGKTALVTNIALNAAKSCIENKKGGVPVLFFSLEMRAVQLCKRILASEANISSSAIRKGILSNEEFSNLVKTGKNLQDVPLFFEDTSGLSLMGLRNRARRWKRKEGIGLIIIDYLQFIHGNKANGDYNRVHEITEISRALKELAKELNVPVLALSQLSRAVENREDKRPHLSDLRDSGTIEQDADVVMFVYREEYYESRREPAEEDSSKYFEWETKMAQIQNKAELIVAKNRHGAVGKIDLFFDGRFTKFGNLIKSA